MDDVIICPNCGETNPADLPYCHSCQWRLKSLDSEWGTERGTMQGAVPQPPSSDDAVNDQVPNWLLQPKSMARPDNSADETAAAQLRDRLAPEGAEDLQAFVPSAGDSEDLLAGLTRAEQPDDEPIPDWVARIMGIPEDDSSTELQSDEPPNQLQSAWGPEYSERWQSERQGPPFEAADDSGKHTSDSTDQAEPVDQPASSVDPGMGGHESEDIYAWLRQLDASSAPPPIPRAAKDVPATTDVPTWVDRMMSVSADAAADADDRSSSLPDWLRTTAPAADQPPPILAAGGSEPVSRPELPPEVDERELQMGAEPLVSAEPPPESRGPINESEGDSFDVDAVFAAMDMPQWSSPSGLTESSGAGAPPSAGHEEEPISPVDLPSWVRAMRPPESGVVVPGATEAVSPQQAGSPLLGLQGVLPAVPGAFVPSSRPKTHAVRLEVSEQHRSQARLLNEILEAEAQPAQFGGKRRVGEPRLLRWVIASLLMASLGIGVISTPGGFLFPATVPNETNAALHIVQELPVDASVLAVFDYEPAMAGEMEVAGASFMDHLLLLKHPRLALISTSPTGSVLAERFISTTLQERAYTRDVQYVDLGYLAGGLSGVQLFAQNPAAALPFGAATDKVWESQVLQGTAALSDFSAIVVLTDNQEGGAAWVEQTTGLRGPVPMVIVASAQAGPMLLPYYDSGQIQGLLVGINGAAGAEIANGGRPGLVRQYWDAYNIGLYAAAGLIVLGALWGLFSVTILRKAEAA